MSQKLGGFGRLDKIGAVALAVAVNTGLSYRPGDPFFPSVDIGFSGKSISKLTGYRNERRQEVQVL